MTEDVAPLQPPHSDFQFNSTGEPQAVLDELRALAQQDGRAETGRFWYGVLFVVAAVVTVASLWIQTVYPVARVGIAVGVVVVISAIALYFDAARKDLDNRKLRAPLAVLEALAGELHRKRPVTVNLDFTGYPQVSAENGKRTVRWLELQFVLLDGTAVALSVTTECKRKEKRKRKYTKITDRVHEALRLRVRMPRGATLDVTQKDRLQERLRAVTKAPMFLEVGLSDRVASFTARTAQWLRLANRAGWQTKGAEQLTGARLLKAIVLAVQSTRAATARTE